MAIPFENCIHTDNFHMQRGNFRWLVTLCLFAVVSFSASAKSEAVTLESNITVLTATDDELKPVLAQLPDAKEQRIRGISFFHGTFQGQPVVVAATGGGKVNAGATAMLMVITFKPRLVVMTGTAGSMNDQLHAGDVVIAEKTAQSDYGTQQDNNFTARGTPNPVDLSRNPIFFTADASIVTDLRQWILRNPEMMPSVVGAATQPHSSRIVMGTIVSHDAFCRSPMLRQQVQRLFRADAMDMESAAVAQICYQQEIPFVAVRGIADQGNDEAGLDYARWRHVAAQNAALVGMKIVERSQKRKETP